MQQKRSKVVLILTMCLGLLAASCNPTPAATPTPDPLQNLEAAVQVEVEARLREVLDSELAHYAVVASELQGDGNYGRVVARVVLKSCPLFPYELIYIAEKHDGQWVLWNHEETLTNLSKRWASARSAARNGVRVNVPGTLLERQVSLIPDGMPELLTARLEGMSNPTIDPLVGFFVCEEDNILWDEIDPALAETVREVIPEVRKAMEADVAPLLELP